MTTDPFIFTGKNISLRKIAVTDCTQSYVDWLNDPEVNRYLETRWMRQDMLSVRKFVEAMTASSDSHLLAIIENFTSTHIGNIKIGPVNHTHGCADISYFIGSKGYWGNGFGTEAIQGAVTWGFSTLGLHTIRAGIYRGNIASRKALEKCGFRECGSFPEALVTDAGREDHVFFSLINPASTDRTPMKVTYSIVDPHRLDQVQFLYELLKERPPEANISHRALPTFDEHHAFVRSFPYANWYIIEVDGAMAGSVYATTRQEIGIHIYTPFRRKKLASEAVLWLIHAQDLDRPLANVAPGNLKSHALFTKLGGKVIQHTYLLDGVVQA